jgi:hypothetical protein
MVILDGQIAIIDSPVDKHSAHSYRFDQPETQPRFVCEMTTALLKIKLLTGTNQYT